jgi:FxsC-like protein
MPGGFVDQRKGGCVREVPAPSAASGNSFFLISYSHTEYYGHGNERDPDYWVIRFYKDLSRNIEELAAVPPGDGVGVLDRDLWVEDDWLAGLPEALASCRVLVPLYTPRYFQSEACGKEWYAFASRSTSQSAQVTQAPAIVPVMWTPMLPGSLHQAVRTVPIEYGGVDSYAQRGLYGIIKRAKYRADYDDVVRGIAQRIITTAKRFPVGPWSAVDFGILRNPFVPAGAPASGAARLLITVVAPQWDDLPPGRDRQYYGSAAWDWTPYRPASHQPIAQYTANFARSLGCNAYVSDLQERAEDLLEDGRVTHPELLIIDPWAVMRPDCRRLLARLNLADKPWVQVAIPWNPADDETAAAENQLRLALDSALGRKLELGRVTSAIAVEGVPTIADFGAILPFLIPTVENRYLAHAPAFPPEGSAVEKPTLHGFTPDPPNPLERAGA